MRESQNIQLLWQGSETIKKVLDLARSPVVVEIQLPIDYHHALFATLNPTAEPGAPEEIDTAGGPELLEKVATLNGLEDIKNLVSPLEKMRATVQLSDHAKITITIM